jgi:serine/threonine protein kinase
VKNLVAKRSNIYENEGFCLDLMAGNNFAQVLPLQPFFPVKIQKMPAKFVVYKSLSSYEIQSQVGEGTYGQVFKAFRKGSKSPVALKKLYLKEDVKGNEKNRDGFPITGIREIEILRSLRHRNIVELEAMV